ncbi:hypothetical protein [Ruminococcus sp.]|uniref:hypothetical protein n=1 Tax=Ruminococcus sp. TaxID=41978 RepID=UPI0026728085|nr:hypothetical protein [uncultured Ruminococcus sp.]
MDKNVGLKCSKTFCQGYGTFCQKTRIRTLSKLKMYVMYVHSLQTPVHALRTTSIIHHSAMFFNAKLTNFCIFLISKSQKPKKERYPNFKFRLQILNPFETQIKKRQEKGSVSRETELKKKILSCAAESVPFVEQKNQNISVGALLQKRTKPDAVPAQR